MSETLIPKPLLEYDEDNYPIVRDKTTQEELDEKFISQKLLASKFTYRLSKYLKSEDRGMFADIMFIVIGGLIGRIVGLVIGQEMICLIAGVILSIPIAILTRNLIEKYDKELHRLTKEIMPAQRVTEFREWANTHYGKTLPDEELIQLINKLAEKTTTTK